jgi:hypothetical protein
MAHGLKPMQGMQAASHVFAAASAQLVVLYKIVASSFTACVVSFLMKYLMKSIADEEGECEPEKNRRDGIRKRQQLASDFAGDCKG